MEYLEFELPIKELEDQLQKCEIIGKESDVDVTETCQQIQTKLELAKKEIYKNLSPWQRVQLSRHPNRPYTLDYINALTKGTFLELHGDRNFKDDKAMIGTRGRSLAVSSAVVPVCVKQQMALMSVVSAISRAADTIPSATEFLLALLEASMTSV